MTANITASTPSADYGQRYTLSLLTDANATCQLSSDLPGGTAQSQSPGTIGVLMTSTATFTWSCTLNGATASNSVTVTMTTPPLDLKVSQDDVKDVVWDPVHQLLYVAFGADSIGYANSVAAFDPVNGTVSASAFAGSLPTTLAVSDGGEYLYVGFRGTSTVARFSLPSLTRDFSIPTAPAMGNSIDIDQPAFVHRIAAATGAPQTFATSLFLPYSSLSNAFAYFVLRDGQTARPGTLQQIYSSGSALSWGADVSTLLSVSSGTGHNGSYINYDTSGSAISPRASLSVVEADPEYIVREGNRLFMSCGGMIDITTNLSLDGFPRSCGTTASTSNQVAPDSANNRTFFSDFAENPQTGSLNPRIQVYDQATRALLHTAWFPFPDHQPSINGIGKLIRWGANGLALVTSSGQLVIITGPFVSDNVSTTPPIGVLPPPANPRVIRHLRPELTTLLPAVVDLAWDAQRQRLYAAVASDAAAHAGEIAVIDVANGEVESYHAPATPASALAITDDGQFLYVGGTNSFARLSLPEFGTNLLVPIGATPTYIRTAPGSTTTVSIGTVIYDDAVDRPQYGGIEWGDTAATMYFADASGHEVLSYSIDANGGTQTDRVSNVFKAIHPQPSGLRFRQAEGLLFSDTGIVYDPERRVVEAILPLGNLLSGPKIPVSQPAWGPVDIDRANRIVHIASCNDVTRDDLCSSTLKSFRLSDYTLTANSGHLDIGGRARKLVQVDDDQFVVITFDHRAVRIHLTP